MQNQDLMNNIIPKNRSERVSSTLYLIYPYHIIIFNYIGIILKSPFKQNARRFEFS
jgi:hypothetical protein